MFGITITPKQLVGLAAALYLVVPASRGVALAAAAAAVALGELRARRTLRGVPVRVLVDGVMHRVPSGGGGIALGDKMLSIRRNGHQVLIDDRPVGPGEFIYNGASQLEVLR